MEFNKNKTNLIALDFKLKYSYTPSHISSAWQPLPLSSVNRREVGDLNVQRRKKKTYVINTNWTIDEFIDHMRNQIMLDADYFGFDIEKQEEIELIPSYNKLFGFSLYKFIDHFNNDEINLPLKSSLKIFKYYFDFNYPCFIIRKK